jgi:hypothetical protein
MNPAKEIDTIVIPLKRYVIFLWSYIFGGLSLSFILGFLLHSLPLLIIGVVVFMVAPVLFSSQFRSGFSKKATLRFYSDRLSVDLVNPDTDTVERTDEFPFAGLASFRTGDSSKDDSSFISLRLSDGRKFNYTFLEQRQGDPSDDVTPNLEESIRQYNRSSNGDHSITYTPSLLASKGGKNLLIGLIVVTAVCVIIQIFVKPKIIPISMLSGSATCLLIFVQRKNDIAKCKAMNMPDGA